ncbi:MAG: NmrA family NAD(P)-binding protein [Anaerolineae bacterium]|nr:NmrA family NAD(P)-binding protein [Anaerolineae bacterium]
MRIVISGAGGKTGQAVRRALAARGADVRPFLHHPTPDPNAIVGDMTRAADWARALDGAAAVLHICPNMHPAEVEIGRLALAAARAAGVRHFVYHSVLHPQTEAMPHHWQKLRVEERLFESGLPFTILQPAPYMQNVLAHRRRIFEDGIYPVPYSAETRLALVDLVDVGEAAATVLLESGHGDAVYELVGEAGLTQDEVAAILSGEIERSVSVKEIAVRDWRRQATANGMESYQVDTLARMFEYYNVYGLTGSPNVLRWLLEREPTSFASFARREFGQQRTSQITTGPQENR